MRRFISLAVSLAIAFAGAAVPADAWIGQKAAIVATSQQILISNATVLNSTTARFIPVGYTATPATSDLIWGAQPVAGAITSMRVVFTVAPTSTQSWSIELYKNGSATGFSCVVNSSSSPAAKCTHTGSVSLAVRDYISWKFTPTNTPNTTLASVSAIFSPTTANDTIVFAQGVALSNSATQAVNPFSNFAPTTANFRRSNTFPDGGTIDNLQVISNAPGAGTSYAYTIDKAIALQTVTCTIANTNTNCPDITHSFFVAAGDDLQIQGAPTGTPAAATAAFGFRYRPTTVGSYAFEVSNAGGADSATVATYYPMTGSNGAGNASETSMQSVSDSQTITQIVVKLSTAPGAGKNRVFTLRQNTGGGAADTSCTVTIADTATTGSASCSISVADYDLLDTSDVPSAGSPATATPAISYLAHR